jgi:hypothetical protein
MATRTSNGNDLAGLDYTDLPFSLKFHWHNLLREVGLSIQQLSEKYELLSEVIDFHCSVYGKVMYTRSYLVTTEISAGEGSLFIDQKVVDKKGLPGTSIINARTILRLSKRDGKSYVPEEVKEKLKE